MLGTLLSIFIAAMLLWMPLYKELSASINTIALLFLGLSFLFPILGAVVNALSWSGLQKVEQNLTPRFLETYNKDKALRYTTLWLSIFPLLIFGLVVTFFLMPQLPFIALLGAGIILFGLSFDALFLLTKRIRQFFNPFMILSQFTKEAKTAIDNDKNEALCGWIDAVAEVAIKAIDRTTPSLAIQAIDELQTIADHFLAASKSMGQPMDDSAIKSGQPDHLSYTLFYLFQRMELINEKALEQRLEPVCSRLITSLGKVAIAAAKIDLSLVSYPLYYMGKFASRGQKERMNDISDKAVCAFIEVSREIILNTNLQYQELKEPFFSLIGHIESIVKETFRQDKTTSIKLLIQPFQELKALFQSERVVSHQDTPLILIDINRVINEFNELDLILRTIPPLSTPVTDVIEKE